MLKNPDDLTAQLRRIRRNRRDVAGLAMKAVPGHLAGDLTRDEAGDLLDRWCALAQRSFLAPFVKVAKTMRQR